MEIPLDQVDQIFSIWDKNDSPGCVLAVIHDGEIIYKRAYGMADLERDVPLSPVSVMDIGSVGKQFTAMVIAILADRGLLSLDENINRYLPEMPAYDHPITIRHLLHHTSGLRDYTSLMELAGLHFENFYYEEEMFSLILRQKELNFEPGEEYLYSNTGYFLLGIIARRITGKTIFDLIRETILVPLGMNSTYCNGDYQQIVKNRAASYLLSDDGGFRGEISLSGGYGDGALLSTVEDLYLWEQNFYDNHLGGGGVELIQHMLQRGILNNGETIDYALGLEIGDYRGLKTVSHSGGWAGYRAELLQFPDQCLSVIILANLGDVKPWKLARKVADLYLEDYFQVASDLEAKETNEFIQLTNDQIKDIVGFYLGDRTGGILGLSSMEGTLMGEVFDLSFPLAAVDTHLFKTLGGEIDIQIEWVSASSDGGVTLNVTLEDEKPELYNKLPVIIIDTNRILEYSGEYYSEELNTSYMVSLESEQLLLKRKYSPKRALKPVTQDIFTCGELTIRFIRNGSDLICALDIGLGRVRNIRFLKQTLASDMV